MAMAAGREERAYCGESQCVLRRWSVVGFLADTVVHGAHFSLCARGAGGVLSLSVARCTGGARLIVIVCYTSGQQTTLRLLRETM